MKKKNKLTLVIVLSSVATLCLGAFGFVYFSYLHHYKGNNVTYEWHKEDAFDDSRIKVVIKDPHKDFTILNLADIQICDLEGAKDKKVVHRQIDYLVKQTKPDLITLTGDQVWSNENRYSLKAIISWLDSYKIPWAPVFGNHDCGNEGHIPVASQEYSCDLYEQAKYCLFDRGPTNIGSLGNYVINIMEGDNIYKTIYMVDAGLNPDILPAQIDYFKWNLDGISASNNGIKPSGMAFMHRPVYEFYDAYYAYMNNEPGTMCQGDIYHYYLLWGQMNPGFFDFALESNIDNIVAGHQHGNSFSILYKNIWCTASLKTGPCGGIIDNEEIYLNGATTFTLSKEETIIKQIYTKKGQFD